MLRQDRDVSVLLLATSKLLLIVFVLLVGDQAGPGGVALGQAYILPPAYPSMVSVLPNVTCLLNILTLQSELIFWGSILINIEVSNFFGLDVSKMFRK